MAGLYFLKVITPLYILAHVLLKMCYDTSPLRNEVYVPLPTIRISLFTDSVLPNSLQPHGLQHARLPCPSPFYGACSNSRLGHKRQNKERNFGVSRGQERTLEICKKLPSRIHLSTDKNMEVRKLLNTR